MFGLLRSSIVIFNVEIICSGDVIIVLVHMSKQRDFILCKNCVEFSSKAAKSTLAICFIIYYDRG